MINRIIQFLSLLVIFTPPANSADPEVYIPPTRNNTSCASAGSGPVRKIPIPNTQFSFPHEPLTHLGKDIMAFDKAVKDLYEIDSNILDILSPHCNVLNFDGLMSIHEKAFEDRKQSDLSHFDEKLIHWVSPKDATVEETSSFPDYFGLETVCRPPKEPPKLQTPVVTDAMTDENKKILARLSKDVMDFYKLQLMQHKTIKEMMRLEQGFRCREVVMAYYPVQASQYARFWDHRAEELSYITESSLQWNTIPDPKVRQ